MAEREGGEPTEEPTPRRLAEARRQGQVARSRELTSTAALAGALIGFAATAHGSFAALRGYLAASLAGATRGGPLEARAALRTAALVGARAVLPVALAGALAAAVVGALQAGGLFTLRPAAPQLGRLSPLRGLGRMLSRQSLAEAGKALLKLAGVALLTTWLLAGRAAELGRLAARAPEVSLGVVAAAALALAVRAAALFAVVGALDLVLARRALRRELRMTRRELLRELRDSEGDPRRKAERARAAGEDSLPLAVADADCLIVAERLAVALRYRPDLDAPRVVASGAGVAAARLVALARQARVPIYGDAALARALARLELGAEVPAPLYEPVAEVLRFAHRASGGARGAA